MDHRVDITRKGPANVSSERLERIARALGRSSEMLLETAHDETFGDDTAELVRLWVKIENPEDRRYLLSEVLRLAANELKD